MADILTLKGEAGNPAETSPIPVIGAVTYTDWRLPTQKELMYLYNAGIRGLNATATMRTNYGDVDSGYIWTSTHLSDIPTDAWHIFMLNGNSGEHVTTDPYGVVCVR